MLPKNSRNNPFVSRFTGARRPPSRFPGRAAGIVAAWLFLLTYAAWGRAADSIHIVLVGDSIVMDDTGWGKAFADQLAPGVRCTNVARGGFSTKLFLDKKNWAEALKLHATYMLIQFGHNDQPGKGANRETDPQTTYRANLIRFVDEARAAGAKPILVTPPPRRNFGEDGKLIDGLAPYAEAMKAVAVEKQVPLVDLHARSVKVLENLGPVKSEELGPMKNGKRDAAHFSAEGAALHAGLIVKELRSAVPALAPSLKSDQKSPVLSDLPGGIPPRTDAAAENPPAGGAFAPDDVDFENPIYVADFANPRSVDEWILEGGASMEASGGKLVLKNGKGPDGLDKGKPLVCWLKKELPADFLIEFSFCPRNRKEGLAIVFFSARGVNGSSVFDPSLAARTGDFKKYHSGDLNNYHISYWSGSTRERDAGKGTPPSSHVRKNFGFHLVAEGRDLIGPGTEGQFQTVRLYKKGGVIRLLVDGVVAVSYDDDGKSFGPILDKSGWFALRQMPHTGYAAYGKFAVYPLK